MEVVVEKEIPLTVLAGKVYKILREVKEKYKPNILQDDDRIKIKTSAICRELKKRGIDVHPVRVGKAVHLLHRMGLLEIVKIRRSFSNRGGRVTYILRLDD